MKPSTVQEYICSKPDDAQARLNELRSYLIEACPDGSEELKWGKPAIVKDGILYVYSAAKKHISFHPTPSVVSQLKEDLKTCIFSSIPISQ